MKNIIPILCLCIALNSCDQHGIEDGDCDRVFNDNPLNPKLELVAQLYSGSMRMGVWTNEGIYSIAPVNLFQLHNPPSVNSTEFINFCDGLFFMNDATPGISYMYASNSSANILMSTKNPENISSGGLSEFVSATCDYQEIRPIDSNISSAVRRTNGDIIYYSYGNAIQAIAGYYLLKNTIEEDSLIVAHISKAGQDEIINGFDVHPTQNLIVIPIISDLYPAKPARIVEYNMDSREADTLAVTFDLSYIRTNLWLRYDKEGDKLLYCSYPRRIYDVSNDDSEIGLLDLTTLEKEVLDVRTKSQKYIRSNSVFPTWSPDYKSIVFGSSEVVCDGSVSSVYALYVLNDIN